MSDRESGIAHGVSRRIFIRSALGVLGNAAAGASTLGAIASVDGRSTRPADLRNAPMHDAIKVAGGEFYLTGPANPAFAALDPTGDAKPLAPLFDLPLTDTSITVGPDGEFYLTGSSIRNDATAFSSTITLWRSPDMRRWLKVRVLKFSSTKVCSPEIHYLKGTFWLTYTREKGGTDLIRFDTADLAASKYRIVRITEEGEDPSLFLDDDGKLYWVMGSGQVARLKADPMEGLNEEPVQISIPPEDTAPQADPSDRVGTRGAFLAKIKGRYHLFVADRPMRGGIGRAGASGGAHDTYVASSENIYEGYGHRYVAFPYAGQTTLFQHSAGEFWATFSGMDSNAIFKHRPGAFPVLYFQGFWFVPIVRSSTNAAQ
jgi:hypothetical protein